MATLRITEAELARNVRAVLEKVQNGIEIVVEHNSRPVAVIKAPQAPGRTIGASIALAKAHEQETGEAPTLDADFAADVEEIIRNRKARNPPAWD